jgi:hypothetical protein
MRDLLRLSLHVEILTIGNIRFFSQKPREFLDECFARFESVINSLRSCGPLAYSDNERAEQLLYALDDSVWGMKITILEESTDFATLYTENYLARSSLMNYLGKVVQIIMLLLLVRLLLLVLVLVAMMITPPTPLSHLLWSLLCLLWPHLLMSSTRASSTMRSPCWQKVPRLAQVPQGEEEIPYGLLLVR